MSHTIHRSVLDRVPPVDGTVRSMAFVTRDDDTHEATRIVEVTIEDWNDLGRPDQLTVTIEPGDALNG